MSPARAALMAYVAFLVVMPGFGIQYFALLIPLGMLVPVRHQAWLLASASAFVVVLYVAKLQDFWPANAVYDDPIPAVAAIFGYIAWAVLVWFVFARLSRLLLKSPRVTVPLFMRRTGCCGQYDGGV